MILSTKLLNLLRILAIGSVCLDVAVATDDLDDTLQQALLLVKLLKSDFAQILRSTDDVTANSTEEENSTCSLPLEEFNSTMAMNGTEVTASGVSLPDVVSTTPLTSETPPTPPNVVTPPGAPMMSPYGSWPPMSMGYPPSGPGRQNFPDENYRFPYRFNRRRMMPDYYYIDAPVKSRANFRRLGSDLTDLGNTPATTQAKTTISPSSATSEATTVHVVATKSSTSSLSTTIAQPSTSVTATIEQPILRITNSTNQSMLATANAVANQAVLPTADSANQSILLTPDSANQSLLLTTDSVNQSILPKGDSANQTIVTTARPNKQSILRTTEESIVPTTIPSPPPAKLRKRVRHKNRVLFSKATKSVNSNRNDNHLNISRHHLRHHTTTTEKYTKDDVEMSQVASELEKEFLQGNTEDSSNLHVLHPDSKINKRRKTTTTMKIFLQGSSRISIPFPENNGFCHFHPENALCGTNL